MTTTAKAILDSVSITLNDTDTVRRWPESELLDYLNDGQKAVVNSNPSEGEKTATVPLVAGTEQNLPTDGRLLLGITHNMGAFANPVAGDAINIVDREQLNTQVPTWHSMTPTGVFENYVYDGRSKSTKFDIYPPAAGTEAVSARYVAEPVNITGLGAGGALNGAELISVSDQYKPALTSYVLYRAMTKDSEYAGNAQIAIAHYQAFANAVGIEVKMEAITNPNKNAAPYNKATSPETR